MTEVSEKAVQTLTFNDKEYPFDELSEKARYFIAQIQDLQAQKSQASARIDQIDVGVQGFTNLLQQELENPEVEEVEE